MAGLSVDPFTMAPGGAVDPFSVAPGAPGMGLGAPSQQDQLQVIGALSRAAPPPVSRFADTAPSLAVNPVSKQLYVQGTVLDMDDAAGILDATRLLGMPPTGLPRTGEWQPITTQDFSQIVESIRNPSTGRLMAKNFGAGVEQLKQLGGAALMWGGAEDTGAGIVRRATRELDKLSPYTRNFTDVESGSDLVDWFTANLAQQGPMLLQAVGASLLGAAAGTAAAGPGVGTFVGGLAGVFGRKAFQKEVTAAAEKYAAGKVGKDSAEYALLRKTAQAAGAATAAYVNNMGIGIGDIYGEMREHGATADDLGSRMTALAGSLPYGALELLPEAAAVARVFGAGGRAALAKGASTGRKLLEYGVKRPAQGALVGGTLEGGTELGQEALVMGLAGEDLTSPEAIIRYINSFMGGAGVGAPIGGLANLRSHKPHAPVNLLQDDRPTATPPAAPPIAPGTQGELDLGIPSAMQGPVLPAGEAALRRGRLGPQQLSLLLQLPAQVQQELDFSGGQQELDFTGEPPTAIPPTIPPFVGPQPRQGRLDLVGGEGVAPTTQERATAPSAPPALTQQLGVQGALQFAPPAPDAARFGQTPAPTQIGLQLGPLWEARRRAAEHELATQQLAQQQDAQRGQDEQRALTQRIAQQQLALAEQDIRSFRNQGTESFADATTEEQAPTTAAQAQDEIGVLTQQVGMLRGSVPRTATPARIAQATRILDALQARVDTLRAQEPASKGGRLKNAANRRRLDAAEREVARLRKQVAAIKPVAQRSVDRPAAPQGATNAVQIESPAEVPVRQAAPGGEAVGETVRGAKKLAGTRKAASQTEQGEKVSPAAKLRRAKPAVDTAATVEEGPKKKSSEPVVETVAAPAEQETAPVEQKATPAEQETAPVEQKATPAERKPRAPRKTNLTVTETPTGRRVTMAEQADESEALLGTAQGVAQDMNLVADTAIMSGEKLDAIDRLVRVAFFGEEKAGKENRAARDRAREFLMGDLAASEDRAVANAIDAHLLDDLKNAFLDVATEHRQLEARRAGHNKPWFDFALAHGLVRDLNMTITGLDDVAEVQHMLDTGVLVLGKDRNKLPESMMKKLAQANEFMAPAEKVVRIDSNIAQRLAQKIRDLNTSTAARNAGQIKKLRADLAALWAQVQEVGLGDFVDPAGRELWEYFSGSGEPKINVYDKVPRVETQALTAEQIQARTQQDKDAEARPRGVRIIDVGDEFDFDDDSGMFRRADTGARLAPMARGKVRLIVAAILSKFARAPKVHIYVDQADLKARNPQLYQRAAASRRQGDFDSTPAAGFSFDGTVVLFTNHLYTDAQVRFVLAHETLGHFGFRALMDRATLARALDAVYADSEKARAIVDQAVAARGMPRHEAIEEYLADYAGTLDTNVLARFWAAIKNALNKLGVTFDDDIARYIVSQSRAYVRNGDTSGQFVLPGRIARAAVATESMQDPLGAGRFSGAGLAYDAANRLVAGNAVTHRKWSLADLTRDFTLMKAAGINAADIASRIGRGFMPMNYAARTNLGARALYDILSDTVRMSTTLRAKYNNMMTTVLKPSIEMLGRKWSSGATQAEIGRTNTMLRVTTLVKFATLDEDALRKTGNLVTVVDNEPTLNEALFRSLQHMGRFTLKQFQDGFSYTVQRAVPNTDEHRQQIAAARDKAIDAVKAKLAAGKVSEEVGQRRIKNLRAQAKEEIEAPTFYEAHTEKFEPMPDLTKDSPVWRMYVEARDTMDESQVDILKANYASALAERQRVTTVAQIMLGRRLVPDERAYLNDVIERYLGYREENSKVNAKGELVFEKESEDRAQQFIASWNRALLSKDTDMYEELLRKFADTQKEYDDLVGGIDALKEKSRINRPENDRFAVQNAIEQLALVATSHEAAEMYAKHSIAGGYAPFGREGGWQVRIQVEDAGTGQVYKIPEAMRQQLLFVQTADKADALRVANAANETFRGNSADGLFDLVVMDSGEWVSRRVRLVALPETSRVTVSTTSEANLADVVRTLTRFGVKLTPSESRRLVQGLTRQSAAARRRLARAGTPGEDPNTMKYISQHLETAASTVARKYHRHRLDKLFMDGDPDSERLWRGDKTEYTRRKAAWEAVRDDPNADPALKALRKREFDDYHFTYITNDAPTMANRYKDEGRRAVAFLEEQSSVEVTDFGSGELASKLRMYTTFAQLGASVATGLLNIIALSTNVLPTMAGRNEAKAFGGGFGWGRAGTALTHALNQTKNHAQSDVAYWDKLLSDPEALKASGFTAWEARFMRQETYAGSMQAALPNALIGSARGKITSGAKQAAVRNWMFFFTYSEQLSRRAAGLADFRLAYDRALQEGAAAKLAGKDLENYAFNEASRHAAELIDNTLGEYAMFNRPAFFRGDVRQFVFIYKMFPVNTFLMLKSMDRKTQLQALGILLLFSGVKGLPFAENWMDLLDTIAQMLGLGPSKLWRGSAEKSVAQLLDAIAPGMTPVAMRGLFNWILPANISDRTSLGDIVPGTGIALAGADVGRELIDIAGPLASFFMGAAGAARDVTRYASEAVGLSPNTTTLTSLLRNSPVTMLRALGDMSAYSQAGAVVNQKGYVVSPDLTALTYLSRATGFYPSAAVRENDVVRIATRMSAYEREVAAVFRSRYVAAMMSKDNRAMQDVSHMVRDWNAAAKGTGLEIRNFEKGARRAYREAVRPASARTLKAAPVGMRSEIADLQRFFGAD